MIPGIPLQGHIRVDNWIRYLPKTEGTISGVYYHSFDIRVMDFLLNITNREEALHPLGIMVDKEMQKLVKVGQKVHVSFPHFGVAEYVIHAEPRIISPCDRIIDGAFLRENIAKLFATIKTFGRCSQISAAYIKKEETLFLKPLLYLCMNLKKNRHLQLDEYLCHFGSGEGLTPGWDDFCTGLLFADRVLKNMVIHVSKDFFKNIRQKTTLQSFWQLRFGEVGKLSLLYERFLGKISSAKFTSTEIVKCINYGHSSGTDILSGIHAYFSAVLLSSTI
jgi:hypothetical protein